MVIDVDDGGVCNASLPVGLGRPLPEGGALSVELSQTVPTRRVFSVPENPYKLDIPVRSMLQRTVDKFQTRHPSSAPELGNNRYTMRVSVSSLVYDHHTDVGIEQPIVTLALYVVLLDASGHQIYDDIFASARIKGRRLPIAFTYASLKSEYHCVVSRAMSDALEEALVDVLGRI
jgi:hypothetical protein